MQVTGFFGHGLDNSNQKFAGDTQKARPTASNIGLIFHYKYVGALSRKNGYSTETRILDGVPDEIGHYGNSMHNFSRLATYVSI